MDDIRMTPFVLVVIRFRGFPARLESLEGGNLGGEAGDDPGSVSPHAAPDRAGGRRDSPSAHEQAARDDQSYGALPLRLLRRGVRRDPEISSWECFHHFLEKSLPARRA